MRYMAEDNQNMVKVFGESLTGPLLSRGIARLYSQHTRLRAGTSGLPSWTTDELVKRLDEAEKLLVAGMALEDKVAQRRYLRRAGEIFEWAATSITTEIPIPVVLLAASAYQLAGYPARASGVLSEYPLPDRTSQILTSLLRADFPEAQRLLIETWRTAENEGAAQEQHIDSAFLDQLLRAFGVLTAWLRWGEEGRIETALKSIEKISQALRYDDDRFSWFLAVLFAAISRKYLDDSLWTVLEPLKGSMNEDGHRALQRYAQTAFLENKMLTWPSQRAGISAILTEGSFALCTPTGSGKTRVAELVILRHLFGQADSDAQSGVPFVLYLAPSRALSAEVEKNLSHSLRSVQAHSVTVTSLYGGNDFGPSDLMNMVEQPTVLISTHEKAEALLRFLGPALLAQISCVIVDEAHTVAFTGGYEALGQAQSRSLRLESLISRLRTMSSPDTAFVALSAVATDIRDDLSAWITGVDGRNAIAPDYRSTRQLFGQLLCENAGGMKIRYDVLDGQRLLVDDQDSAPYVPSPFPPHPPTKTAINKEAKSEKRMRAHLLWVAMHFAQERDGKTRSVLVSVAEHPEWYAGTFLTLIEEDWVDIECPNFFDSSMDERRQTLFARCLASCADYFGTSSREYRLLGYGIVLHHGKMPSVMSRLLIELIQSNVINIVIATSTLSEGVNLPFETVLIPSLRRGNKEVGPKQVINVAGRAGRPGVSTEGRTLVLFAEGSREKGQKLSRQAYHRVIQHMTGDIRNNSGGPHSPLYALIGHIEKQWSIVSKSNDFAQFIAWLETAAFSATEDKEGKLLPSLDTLDQHLLTSIEEAESLNHDIDTEEFLQSLWRNTLARHDSFSNDDDHAQKVFTQRGKALVETIYPERGRRHDLYHTGLPPRDGSLLIEELSTIKSILQEAEDFAMWDIQERLSHIIRLGESIAHIETFRVPDLGSIPWPDVLAWWMAPNLEGRKPNPKSVSTWYYFASTNFIYRLNWGIGSAIGSILERDGGDGQFLERWERTELPWAVLWYKDMITWGVLDPIESSVLTRKQAYTRPRSRIIAAEYWESVDTVSDAAFRPNRVAEWMHLREEASLAPEGNDLYIPHGEIAVELLDDFSKYKGVPLRVLPTESEQRIDWYDPAGFRLARSEIFEDWPTLKAMEMDFMLDPMLSAIVWTPYL